MRYLFALLLLLFLFTDIFAQQTAIIHQPNQVAISNQTIPVQNRRIVMPYDTSPCTGVDPVFFLRVEDVFSITGVGTIAQGDVLEGKATAATDIVIVEAAMFWDVMLSNPKGLKRYNSLVALRDSPTFSKKTMLTSIHHYRQQLTTATKGMRSVGVSLRGIAVREVKRGHYVFGLDFPKRFSECSCLPENSSATAQRPRQN